MADLVGHRAQQEALGAGHALVADDDEVGALLLGDVEDRVGRVALTREQRDLDALLLGHLGRGGERRVDVLARVDHPAHVVRRLRGLLAQPRRPDRREGGHDQQGRADVGRQLGGLADGLARRLGSVGAHHDRPEHGGEV